MTTLNQYVVVVVVVVIVVIVVLNQVYIETETEMEKNRMLVFIETSFDLASIKDKVSVIVLRSIIRNVG